jgi:alkylation response protein AidB-like acyl-CoA dehydrogenase
MALTLSDEQTLVRDTARDFFKASAPTTELRRLRDSGDPAGFSRDLWRQMAELGWTGILFPEDYGGNDFGFLNLGLVMEEAGRTLAASPLFSTVVLAGSAVLLAGSEAQRRRILPAISAGELVMALAVDERPRHDPAWIETRAEKADGGFRLSGHKTFVLDGGAADEFVLVARTSGGPRDTQGLTLFLAPADAPGLTRAPVTLIDSRNAANLGLDGVSVAADAVLGPVDGAWPVLEQVLDRGRIALAAEMLGAAQEALDLTVEYLKTRKQFGVPIGSFQALKHRAAEMFCQIELSKSAVLEALSAVDERRNDLPQLASLAKERLSDTSQLVTNECLQMHAGIGMTDEHDIGLFLKRARVAAATFGDAFFHRDRYAALESY